MKWRWFPRVSQKKLKNKKMQREAAQSFEKSDFRMSNTNADSEQKMMVPLVHFFLWNRDDGSQPPATTPEISINESLY